MLSRGIADSPGWRDDPSKLPAEDLCLSFKLPDAGIAASAVFSEVVSKNVEPAQHGA
jgi:hypothetical protein